jgi:hypothetical protein
MAVSDPIAKARACRTAKQAARLMARLEHEISHDSNASEEWYALADRAIDDLRIRFPTARTLDAYLEPPASSPAARAGLNRHGRRSRRSATPPADMSLLAGIRTAARALTLLDRVFPLRWVPLLLIAVVALGLHGMLMLVVLALMIGLHAPGQRRGRRKSLRRRITRA